TENTIVSDHGGGSVRGTRCPAPAAIRLASLRSVQPRAGVNKRPPPMQGHIKAASDAGSSMSGYPGWDGLFGLLVGRRRMGSRPGIVFFLRLGNPIEGGLVGFLVHLRLLLACLVGALLLPPAAAHLRLRGHSHQREDHCRRNSRPVHTPVSPAVAG